MKILVGYRGTNVGKDLLELAANHARAFAGEVLVITSLPGGEKTGVEQLKSEGMEVVVTVDRKSFEDAVAPAYEEYYKRFDKKLIEDIRNTR